MIYEEEIVQIKQRVRRRMIQSYDMTRETNTEKCAVAEDQMGGVGERKNKGQ